MSTTHQELASQLGRLAAKLPYETAQRLAQILDAATPQNAALTRGRVLELVNQPELRHDLEQLLSLWQNTKPWLDGSAISLGLLSAAENERSHRLEPTLDLVWTGPSSQFIPLRRTDQALLQVIAEAHHRILLVSFAVYKISAAVEALAAAAARGVQITLCLESPQESEGRLAYDNLKAFGALPDRCQVLIWPLDKRPRNVTGKPAALHAKLALADGHVLLLSSANLTEYALQMNMELGLLIRGGKIPGQVESHFQELLRRGELEPI